VKIVNGTVDERAAQLRERGLEGSGTEYLDHRPYAGRRYRGFQFRSIFIGAAHFIAGMH